MAPEWETSEDLGSFGFSVGSSGSSKKRLIFCYSRCKCGKKKTEHAMLLEVQVSFADAWNLKLSTRAMPTDAFGIIEFQGDPQHTLKAHVSIKVGSEGPIRFFSSFSSSGSVSTRIPG